MRALTVVNTMISNEQEFIQFKRLGDEALAHEDYQRAIDYFNQALYLFQYDDEVWLSKGKAIASLKQLDDARQCFENALAINPNNDKAWHAKGLSLHMQRKFEEALVCFERAISLHPNSDINWQAKGVVLYLLGHYRQALQHFERALQIYPQNHNARLFREDCLKKLEAAQTTRPIGPKRPVPVPVQQKAASPGVSASVVPQGTRASPDNRGAVPGTSSVNTVATSVGRRQKPLRPQPVSDSSRKPMPAQARQPSKTATRPRPRPRATTPQHMIGRKPPLPHRSAHRSSATPFIHKPIEEIVKESPTKQKICGNCGAFYHTDAVQCPDCQKDVRAAQTCECAICGVLIPADTTHCPNCQFDFEHGELLECAVCGATVSSDDEKCPSCNSPLLEEIITCARCGAEISEEMERCPACGLNFEETYTIECGNCGAPLEETMEGCPNCHAVFHSVRSSLAASFEPPKPTATGRTATGIAVGTGIGTGIGTTTGTVAGTGGDSNRAKADLPVETVVTGAGTGEGPVKRGTEELDLAGTETHKKFEPLVLIEALQQSTHDPGVKAGTAMETASLTEEAAVAAYPPAPGTVPAPSPEALVRGQGVVLPEASQPEYSPEPQEDILSKYSGMGYICPGCRHAFTDDFLFCTYCGYMLRKRLIYKCTLCGEPLAVDESKCSSCGNIFGEEVYYCATCGAEIEESTLQCSHCKTTFDTFTRSRSGSRSG